MRRIRPVVKYGGSHLIKLSPSDLTDYSLAEGDSVDITDIIKEVKK